MIMTHNDSKLPRMKSRIGVWMPGLLIPNGQKGVCFETYAKLNRRAVAGFDEASFGRIGEILANPLGKVTNLLPKMQGVCDGDAERFRNPSGRHPVRSLNLLRISTLISQFAGLRQILGR